MKFYLKNALIVSILISQTYYAEPKKLTDSAYYPDQKKLTDSEKVQYEKYYSEKIYNKNDVEQYLNQINKYFFIEPLKEVKNFSMLTKVDTYNIPLIADLTLYYQYQLIRAELFSASRKQGTRSEKYTLNQIQNMANQINSKIDMLVKMHIDDIAAFEKTNLPAIAIDSDSSTTRTLDFPVGNNTNSWQLPKTQKKLSPVKETIN